MRISLTIITVFLFMGIYSCSGESPSGPDIEPTITPTITQTHVPVACDDPAVKYYGRWDMDTSPYPMADWNAVYIKLSFSGTGIAVKLQDGNNNWWARVDGGSFRTIITSEAENYQLASGLSDSAHELFLVRRTESYFGPTAVKGFEIDDGGRVLPAPTPGTLRKIEVVGDSIAVGYEVEGAGTLRYSENGYLAYGPRLAEMFGAEWSIIGRKGIGVSMNNSEHLPGDEPHMIDIYPRALYSYETPEWDFSSWVPDVVIINLGANDYYTLTTDPTQAQFEQDYEELITYIRGKYPDAHIFCMGPLLYYDMYDACKAYIKNVVDNYEGPKVYYIDVDSPEPWLDDGDYVNNAHPDEEGHMKAAQKLYDIIQPVMGW